MLTSVLIVLGIVIMGGVSAKSWTWLRRWRVISQIPADRIEHIERGIGIRALLYGVPPMLGLNPRRTNLTTGDLVLTKDRFVLTSGRGVLADLGPERGRRFTSARCTGPSRLVIEGDIPRPDGGLGQYRFELVVADASGWAKLLSPFVREGEDGDRFTSLPQTP